MPTEHQSSETLPRVWYCGCAPDTECDCDDEPNPDPTAGGAGGQNTPAPVHLVTQRTVVADDDPDTSDDGDDFAGLSHCLR
jgi:hypothetical protein